MTENQAAFPYDEKSSDGTHWHSHAGMTLRDWFAGQGMQVAGEANCRPGDWATAARRAYAYADAMLAARSNPSD